MPWEIPNTSACDGHIFFVYATDVVWFYVVKVKENVHDVSHDDPGSTTIGVHCIFVCVKVACNESDCIDPAVVEVCLR
jgi:hypothetical protein